VFIYCQVDKYATTKREAIKIIEQQIAELQKGGGGSDERSIIDGYCIVGSDDDMQFVLEYIKKSSANRLRHLFFAARKDDPTIRPVLVCTIKLYVSEYNYFSFGGFNGTYSVSADATKEMIEFLQTFKQVDTVE